MQSGHLNLFVYELKPIAFPRDPFSNHFRWDPSRKTSWGNILGHNTAGCNNRALSNSDPFQNNCTFCYPDMILKSDISGVIHPFARSCIDDRM